MMKYNTNNKTLNPSWIQWLIGLFDAEGNFQVSPKKRTNREGVITYYGVLVGFHLGMHLRDHALLIYIQQMLGGLGKIYLYPGKEEAHYAITKKEELKMFVDLIMSQFQLLTSHQLQRFLVLNKVLTENIVSIPTLEEFKALLNTQLETPKLDTSIPYLSSWIVGFINGEGSFSIVKDGNVFVFLLEHTDLAVLKLIKEELDLALPVYTLKLREGRKQTYSIKVSSRSDIGKVVSFLDASEPLKGYKFEQYESWKEKWIIKCNGYGPNY